MNWERVRLGDVCNMKSGGTPSRKKSSFFGGNIKWCKISDIENATEGIVYDTEEKITEEGLSDINGRIFSEGTLLLAMYGSVGKVAFINEQMSVNQAILGINIKNLDILDSNFLYYWFIGERRNLLNKAVGVTLKNISKGIVESLTIPLPPLSVQKEIVEKLDKAAAIREKSKALLTYYDALAESLFIELFGDPISNEKGWEKKKLGEVVTNLNNMRVPLKSSDRQMLENKYPYYGASGIIDYVDDFIYDGDNLLIGEDGANLLSRSTPIAFIAKGKYWVNNHAHVNGYNGKSNLIYLCFFINKIDLSPYVTGSAQPKLNRGNLDNIEIPLPPLSLQVKFAEMVENIEKQKARAKAEIEQSEAVFQALLQESFG